MLWRILCCYAKRMEDGRDVETCNSIFLWYRKSNKLLKENLIMSEDTQFQIECLSDELVEMLMCRYGWDMKKALDELYSSETYKRLCNPACGLFYEGAVYVFSYLGNEIETGVVN